LLDVRPNAAIDFYLLEFGVPSLDVPVKAAQTKFVSRLLCLRQYTLETIHSWKYR